MSRAFIAAFIILALVDSSFAQLEVRDAGWIDARGIVNGSAFLPSVHMKNADGSGFLVLRSVPIMATFEEYDRDTALSVLWCDGSTCRVCREVSNNYIDKSVPYETKADAKAAGYTRTTAKYVPGVPVCDDLDTENIKYVKFGSNSTEIYFYTNTSATLDGDINDQDGSKTVSTTATTAYVGSWRRGSGLDWNYTYRNFYTFNDTREIPDDANVINFTVYLTVYDDSTAAGRPEVRVYAVDIGTTLDTTDFDAWNGTAGTWDTNAIGKSGATPIAQLNGYIINRSFYNPTNYEVMSYNLNPSNVNKTGSTTIMLKADNDTLKLPAVDDDARLRMVTTEWTGSSYEPYAVCYYEAAAGCTPSWQNDTWTYEGFLPPVNHANISCNATDELTLNWTNNYWNWTALLDLNGCDGYQNDTIYYDNGTVYNYTYEACDYCIPVMGNTTQTTTLEPCNISNQQLNSTWWVQWDIAECGTFSNLTWYDNETLLCGGTGPSPGYPHTGPEITEPSPTAAVEEEDKYHYPWTMWQVIAVVVIMAAAVFVIYRSFR